MPTDLTRTINRASLTPFPQHGFIRIVADERDPNAGGASHVYKVLVDLADEDSGPSVVIEAAEVHFTHGPLHESGSVVGCTNEALIDIVIDRLESFQAGGFSCDENARALHHLQCAMDALLRRQTNRAARGVLGRNKE